MLFSVTFLALLAAQTLPLRGPQAPITQRRSLLPRSRRPNTTTRILIELSPSITRLRRRAALKPGDVGAFTRLAGIDTGDVLK